MNFVFRDIADMEHPQSVINCLQFVLNLLKLIVIIYLYINIRYNNMNTCTYTAY